MARHRLASAVLAVAGFAWVGSPASAQLDEARERARIQIEREQLESQRNRLMIERGRIESDRLRDEGVRRQEGLRPLGNESMQRNRDPRPSVDSRRPEAQQQKSDRLKREEERLREKQLELYFDEVRRR